MSESLNHSFNPIKKKIELMKYFFLDRILSGPLVNYMLFWIVCLFRSKEDDYFINLLIINSISIYFAQFLQNGAAVLFLLQSKKEKIKN